MTIPLDPCPPCKIIINGGLMATLAPIIARSKYFAADVRQAAGDLADAAKAHTEMLRVLHVSVPTDYTVGRAGSEPVWSGCDEARQMVRWITGGAGPTPDAAERMKKWTRELWSAVADIVDGKLPDVATPVHATQPHT